MAIAQLIGMGQSTATKQSSGWVAALAAVSASALVIAAAHAEQMTRPATGATQVSISTVGDLVIRPGTDEKVIVEAEPKVLAKLDVSIKGDTLTIATKGDFSTQKPVKFTVTLKALRRLTTSGSGSSLVDGFSGPNFDVDVNGSGDVSLKNIKATKLNVRLQSSGNVDVTGSGTTVIARIDGSGSIDAREYKARVVEATIDGAGNISVHADESLKAAISGAGNIEYKGKPKVSQNVTGAGTVGPL